MALQIQMSNREKYAVGAGAFVVALIIIFQFVITPFFDARKAKRHQFFQLISQIAEMKLLKNEYEQSNDRNSESIINFDKRDKNFTLFSFLEKLAGTTKIKDNISYMKPSTSINKETKAQLSLVSIKFNSIVMEQLMEFLHGVETSADMIFVRGISISKTGKDVKFLNVILQIETVKR